MRILVPALALTLGFGQCQSVTPPRQNATLAKLGDAESARNSQISAYSEATETAIEQLPDSNPKTAAFESNSVVRRLAGPATSADRLEAQRLVNLALIGKLDEAQRGFEAKKQEADAKNTEISNLKTKLAAEQANFDAKLQAQLDAANKKWQTIILFGGGALLSVAGVVMLIMAGNPVVAAAYAFLGPKAGFALLGAGLTLITIGIAVNSIERAFERHPYVFIGSLCGTVALLAAAGGLIYANHKHQHG